MPIIAPEILQKGEKKLLFSILSSLDELQVEKLFQDTHGLSLKEKLQFKKGKIIGYHNQIAYKFDFRSVVEFSVLVDEKGNFSGFTHPNGFKFPSAKKNEGFDKIIDPEIVQIRKTEFLESLSATISNRSITELLRTKFKGEIVDKMIYREGEIVIFNDHITYQFLYDVEVIFSILIDREGNYIDTSNVNKGWTLEEGEYPEKTGFQNSDLEKSPN